MRPRLQLLDDALIARILDEAKRILAEVGMEVRGVELRRRLLEAGLPTSADGRVPVSYTHLDVYKRQKLRITHQHPLVGILGFYFGNG